MKITKYWEISANNISADDYDFLLKLNCDVETIEAEITTLTTVTGFTYKVITSPQKIIIKTACEKQEIMLLLKYDSKIFLTNREITYEFD
jgi:hypothetical protein